MHKAGFVNIVGNPNVGKSTLMNALVGERISIATFKAQTTRHRIMGIYNTDDMQIVFSDTPGVLKPQYKLQESMLNFSTSALTDADVLLYVTDVVETPDKHNEFIEKVARMEIPVLLLINKIDLSNQEKLVELVEAWKALLPNAEIIPISATTKFNVEYVMKRVKELLPDWLWCALAYSTPLRKLQVGIIFSWILKEKRRLFNYRSAKLYRWWRLEISSLRVRAKKRG